MIVISFLPQQGLGNQLWLLFTAISLAKYYHLPCKVLNPQSFKGWNLISDSFAAQLSTIHYHDLPKDHILLKPSLFVYESGNFYFPYDLKAFAYITCFDCVVLEDVCQSVHLLEGKDIISDYFHKPCSEISTSPNTCIINIRGGTI